MKWSGTKEGWDRLVSPLEEVSDEDITMRELIKNHYLLQIVTEKCLSLEKTNEGYHNIIKADIEGGRLHDMTVKKLEEENLTLKGTLRQLENKLNVAPKGNISSLEAAKHILQTEGYIFYKQPANWGKGKRGKKQ